MSELKEYKEIPGILDSIENRCILLRLIIPMVEHQPEYERCIHTLLEDNFASCQVLVDAFCILGE